MSLRLLKWLRSYATINTLELFKYSVKRKPWFPESIAVLVKSSVVLSSSHSLLWPYQTCSISCLMVDYSCFSDPLAVKSKTNQSPTIAIPTWSFAPSSAMPEIASSGHHFPSSARPEVAISGHYLQPMHNVPIAAPRNHRQGKGSRARIVRLSGPIGEAAHQNRRVRIVVIENRNAIHRLLRVRAVEN